MNIIEALNDPKLLGASIKKPESFSAWFVFLKALFALPMTKMELEVFAHHTGRSQPPAEPVKEAWICAGRRSGKSFISSLIVAYLSCFRDYSDVLTVGETATVQLIASDRKQARVLMRYVTGILMASPILCKLVDSETKDSIELTNGCVIEIHTSSYRAVRGYTLVACLCDEISFWRDETSANPDREIISALRPALATTNGLLLGFSSPYARRGVLYEQVQAHYGKESSDKLIWQAETRAMNPTIPQRIVDDAMREDPISARAEWFAEFRNDCDAFLRSEWIDSATMLGVFEVEAYPSHVYHGFVDPSGGGSDSFTIGIAHSDDDVFHLDVIKGWKPPFSPESVVAEIAEILRRYGLSSVTGDRYAGQWVTEAFAKQGIDYRHSEKDKSAIYLEVEPSFATGKVRILDDTPLINELRQLERRTQSGGRDRIDHPQRGHDDMANAACGALWLCAANARYASDDLATVNLYDPAFITYLYKLPSTRSETDGGITIVYKDDF